MSPWTKKTSWCSETAGGRSCIPSNNGLKLFNVALITITGGDIDRENCHYERHCVLEDTWVAWEELGSRLSILYKTDFYTSLMFDGFVYQRSLGNALGYLKDVGRVGLILGADQFDLDVGPRVGNRSALGWDKWQRYLGKLLAAMARRGYIRYLRVFVMADDVLVCMVEWTWWGYKRWPRVFAIVARALVPSISAHTWLVKYMGWEWIGTTC